MAVARGRDVQRKELRPEEAVPCPRVAELVGGLRGQVVRGAAAEQDRLRGGGVVDHARVEAPARRRRRGGGGEQKKNEGEKQRTSGRKVAHICSRCQPGRSAEKSPMGRAGGGKSSGPVLCSLPCG